MVHNYGMAKDIKSTGLSNIEQRYRFPKRKDGQKTFSNILKVAKNLFAANSFSSTSINQIIEESKIATGTFYLYFDDKLAVYQYLLVEYSKTIKGRIKKATESCQTREEIERAGIRAFLELALEDPLCYKIIWESMLVDWDSFYDYYSSFARSYIKNLLIAESKEQIRNDIDLETLSYCLMGISNFVGLQVLFKENISRENLDKIVDSVVLILKKGFLK